MQTYLDHFRALATRLEADRIAYNTAQADLLEKINAAYAAAARIEEAGGNASKHHAEVRRFKTERTNLKAPSFINPLPNLESYARTHKDAVSVEPVTAKVPDGQTPLAVHNNQTEKTNRVIAQIGGVIAAPAEPNELAANIAAQIDAIATPPRVVGGKLVFPRHVIDSNGMALTVVNTEGMFAWLHGDAIAEKLAGAAELDGPGMTAAARGEKLAALYNRLVTALRLEAAAAMAAEQAGQRVIRRRHVHPAILLGVQVAPAAVWDWMTKKRGA